MTMNLDKGWNGITVVESFKNWLVQNYRLITLPNFVCWFIWADRNKAPFEDLSPSIHRIVYLSRSSLEHSWKPLKHFSPHNLVPTYPADKTLSWFDGETQQNGHISGVGGIINLYALREYRWTMNCGKGSNMRDELLGAWATLVLTARFSVYDIHIMGDSKIIIDWLNKIGDLWVANLEAWKDRIDDICSLYRSITFEHIYREMNKKADCQSKQAFYTCRGKITYTSWMEGHKGPTQYIYL
jgi:ribonuclease HI